MFAGSDRRGVGRNLGHVGDPQTHEVAGKKLTTAVKPRVHFDQAQVDYLLEQFQALAHNAPKGRPEEVFAWVHECKGEFRVIEHIQSLINAERSPE